MSASHAPSGSGGDGRRRDSGSEREEQGTHGAEAAAASAEEAKTALDGDQRERFETIVDGVIGDMMKSGAFARLYDRWFMQPIPPNNSKLNLPLSDATKSAWANPNDKPLEEYAQK